jgi:phage terminase small subunit
MALTPRQARFVEEYLVDLNATAAAKRASYSAKTAASQGERLLRNVEVAQAIAEAREARTERTGVTVDRVLKELAAIGFADMGTYLTLDGEGTTVRLDWSALPEGATKIIQEITQEEHTGGRGHDTGQVRRTKFKLYSKLDALEKIGRHLGMFTDKLKVEGSVLDDLTPHELAALVDYLRAAGFGGTGRSGTETRH